MFSQVILSLQLGFAVVPLMLFTSDPRIMGSLANSRLVRAVGYALGAGIVLVNAWLVAQSL